MDAIEPMEPAQAWSTSPVIEWLILEGWRIQDPRDLTTELCQRLQESGIPIWRAFFGIPSLHPQYFGVAFIYRRGQPIERGFGPWSMRNDATYTKSPFAVVADEGAAALRRRLTGPHALLDFPVLEELKEQGATDYVVLPMEFSDGDRSGVSFATDDPAGFTARQLAQLVDLMPVIARLYETYSIRTTATNLLDTYLGADVGRRVLAGQVQRGSTETIFAAIWSCDLRGFSRLSETLRREELIALLNDFFDVMATAVQGHQGQVLKFIGDGLLAIFPVADAGSEALACRRALAAARDAAAALDAANERRVADGAASIDYGLALHLGEVTYGNIGGSDRLDFTVIGPAVNVAARLEALCRPLRRRPLMTAAFAGASGEATERLGHFALRGIAAEHEVHALADSVPLPAG